jgi:hypothetical protein
MCVRFDRGRLNPPLDGKTRGSAIKTRLLTFSTLGSKLGKAEGKVGKLSGASMLVDGGVDSRSLGDLNQRSETQQQMTGQIFYGSDWHSPAGGVPQRQRI